MELQPDFFQIRSDALHFLLQAVAQFIELLDLGVNLADVDCKIGGFGVEALRGGVVRRLIALLIEQRNFLIVLGLFFFERGDFADAVLQLLALIVEAGVVVAADASAAAEELLGFVERGSVLRPSVGGMALLAAGIVIFGIVERPEPVFIAAVCFFHADERAAIASVAGRAAEFIQRMPGEKILVRMAGERRVVALLQSEVGFRERQRGRNVFRLHTHMAGLATVGEADAADVVNHRAGWVDVDLDQRNVEAIDSFDQAFERGGAKPRQFVAEIFAGGVLRGFHRRVNLALLGGELRFGVEQIVERAVQLIIIELAGDRLSALFGPIHGVGLRFGLLNVFEAAFLLTAMTGVIGNNFVVVNQRTDQAAVLLKGAEYGRALLVHDRHLLSDLIVLRSGHRFGLLRGGGQLLIIR